MRKKVFVFLFFCVILSLISCNYIGFRYDILNFETKFDESIKVVNIECDSGDVYFFNSDSIYIENDSSSFYFASNDKLNLKLDGNDTKKLFFPMNVSVNIFKKNGGIHMNDVTLKRLFIEVNYGYVFLEANEIGILSVNINNTFYSYIKRSVVEEMYIKSETALFSIQNNIAKKISIDDSYGNVVLEQNDFSELLINKIHGKIVVWLNGYLDYRFLIDDLANTTLDFETVFYNGQFFYGSGDRLIYISKRKSDLELLRVYL